MANVIPESDRTIYQCAACGMRYAERDWAEQCEAWCRAHGTCNVEIIRHAIQPVRGDSNPSRGETL